MKDDKLLTALTEGQQAELDRLRADLAAALAHAAELKKHNIELFARAQSLESANHELRDLLDKEPMP